MPVDELLLNGPVKSFQVAVRLRMSGVVKEMHQIVILAGLIEVLKEFAAVIGLDMADGKWGHAGEFLKKVPAIS